MATQSEPPAQARDFPTLFRDARREVVAGAGNVREIRIELDGPPLDVRSRLLLSKGLTFVFGENTATENLTLCHEGREAVESTNDTIKEIAAAVGYTHPNHFSTAFRRFYGLSPAEHRRAHRG